MVDIVEYKGLFITQPEPLGDGGQLIITDFKIVADRLEVIDQNIVGIEDDIDSILNGENGVVTIDSVQTITGAKTFDDIRIDNILTNRLMTVNANKQVIDSGYTIQDILDSVNVNVEGGSYELLVPNTTYTIADPRILATSNPMVTLISPSADVTLFSLTVTNITDGQFDVILSGRPDQLGYKINWMIF